METWKGIKGFENEYEISNQGNLRSKDRFVKHYKEGYNRFYKGSIKKVRLSSDGYLKCNLKKDGNRYDFRVHRLVAIAFLSNNQDYELVNHINGIKTDNRVENLEWCNAEQNMLHAIKIRLVKTKLTDEEVIEIYNSTLSNRKLGIKYKINASIVWRIKNKKAYKHLWLQHYL